MALIRQIIREEIEALYEEKRKKKLPKEPLSREALMGMVDDLQEQLNACSNFYYAVMDAMSGMFDDTTDQEKLEVIKDYISSYYPGMKKWD